MRIRSAALLAAGALLVVAGGCAGLATFVAVEPPPDTSAEAWFVSRMPAVRSAIRQAMTDRGFTIDPDETTATVLVGTKQQLPHVGEESGGPARGPLPIYRIRAALSRPGDTHVRVRLRAVCEACDGATPYQWEYPDDLIRRVFERTRDILPDRRPRFVYPPRYRPPPWHPPRHRW